MHILYTLGYQKRTQEEIMEILWDFRIPVLLDIRLNPQSRIKGMSKNQLKQALEEINCTYICLSELGIPDMWKKLNFRITYEEQILDTSLGILELILLILRVSEVCLLCLERDYRKCHRLWIAERLQKIEPELTIVHL